MYRFIQPLVTDLFHAIQHLTAGLFPHTIVTVTNVPPAMAVGIACLIAACLMGYTRSKY